MRPARCPQLAVRAVDHDEKLRRLRAALGPAPLRTPAFVPAVVREVLSLQTHTDESISRSFYLFHCVSLSALCTQMRALHCVAPVLS